MTIEVLVDSAIAAGIVPLNVKATVSFAIASNRPGLMKVASGIIEGHLRDSIALLKRVQSVAAEPNARQAQQEMTVGVEQSGQDSKTRAAGIRAQVEAERRKIGMLALRYKAEIVTPDALALARNELLAGALASTKPGAGPK